MIAPQAPRKQHIRSLHGDMVDDPWFWLREKSDPEVIAHIEVENAYASAILEPTSDLQEAIFTEIKDRTLETDLAVPAQKGEYWYATRTEEGESYAIRVRMHGGPDGPSELVLDENAEAEGNDYFRLGNFSVSADHHFVAYSVDTTGAESYTTRIREITTQQDLPDVLNECRYGLAWSSDGAHLFYTVADEALRPYQIWRHEVGTDQADDVLVIQEDDDRYFFGLGRTRSGDFIVITADSAVTESAWVIPADDATTEPRAVLPRIEGVEYSIDHRDDVFWVVINDEGADGRLATVPVLGGSLTEMVAHETGRKLVAPMCFADHVLVWGRANGLPAVFTYGNERLTPIEFDEPVYEVAHDANNDFSPGGALGSSSRRGDDSRELRSSRRHAHQWLCGTAVVRIRGIRDLHACAFLDRSSQPARPRCRVRDRTRSRRRGDGQGVVREREAGEQAQHLFGSCRCCRPSIDCGYLFQGSNRSSRSLSRGSHDWSCVEPGAFGLCRNGC